MRYRRRFLSYLYGSEQRSTIPTISYPLLSYLYGSEPIFTCFETLSTFLCPQESIVGCAFLDLNQIPISYPTFCI